MGSSPLVEMRIVRLGGGGGGRNILNINNTKSDKLKLSFYDDKNNYGKN